MWVSRGARLRIAEKEPGRYRNDLYEPTPWRSNIGLLRPLSDFWDQYDVPAVFTGEARDQMISGNGLTWQAITYAVWDAHVAGDRTLAPHPGKIEATLYHPSRRGPDLLLARANRRTERTLGSTSKKPL